MADSDNPVMIRAGGGEWRTPTISAYTNERALQDILMESPALIPGVGPGAVCVDEVPIAGSGSLDLLAVEPDGSITLVECKLATNAEARRAVAGQLASYAAGLWAMNYEAFDRAFHTRSGLRLADSFAGAEADDEWDTEVFRQAVTENLADGRFRLVIAVDSITEELKRIVEYLNAHTTADVEFLALEIGYVREGDTEILLPATHGGEGVRLKGTRSTRLPTWTVDDVFDRLASLCTAAEVAGVRRIGSELARFGGYWQAGKGASPSMSAYIAIGPDARLRSVVAVYADHTTRMGPRLTINLGSLAKDLPEPALEEIVAVLSTSPTLASRFGDAQAKDYAIYPAVSLSDLNGDAVIETFLQAIRPHLTTTAHS